MQRSAVVPLCFLNTKCHLICFRSDCCVPYFETENHCDAKPVIFLMSGLKRYNIFAEPCWKDFSVLFGNTESVWRM